MPAWIIMALRLLAAGAVGGAAGETTAQVFGDLGESPLNPGGEFGLGGTAIAPRARVARGTFDHHGVWHERPHRRRRRRALTASDRADIAFIAGLLGTAAGSKFAAIIGAK